MSRGFVKEDDQEEVPMVPPRAHLPAGVPNYVTQAGMDELLAEQQALTNKKAGDKVVLKRPKGDHVFEIMDISYR